MRASHPEPADDSQIMPTQPAQLETQSSFAENHDPLYRSVTLPANSFPPESLMEHEEAEERKKSAFAQMFECPVKNLVEFVDKKAMP